MSTQCQRAYGSIFEPSQHVCAGQPNGGKGPCAGDSGGPLYVKTANGPVQYGIVSFGNECALAKYPGVYARLSTYVDMVLKVTGPLPSDPTNATTTTSTPTPTQSATPINGGWSSWTLCPTLCGIGSQRRTCSNPAPSNNGRPCVGASTRICGDPFACFGWLTVSDGSPNTSTFVVEPPTAEQLNVMAEVSDKQCMYRCHNSSTCNAFTFVSSSPPACVFYSFTWRRDIVALPVPAPSPAVRLYLRFNALPSPAQLQGWTVYERSGIVGERVGGVLALSSWNQCSETCLRTRACTSFTYTGRGCTFHNSLSNSSLTSLASASVYAFTRAFGSWKQLQNLRVSKSGKTFETLSSVNDCKRLCASNTNCNVIQVAKDGQCTTAFVASVSKETQKEANWTVLVYQN